MKQVEVHSLDELAHGIFDFGNEANGWLWFRGQEDSRWKLIPRIHREHTPGQERSMVHHFYSRAGTRNQRCPSRSDWSAWLSLMQHYGLPTRLLDWSTSAIVAAYFATESFLGNGRGKTQEDFPKSAAIWVLDATSFNSIRLGENIAPNLNSKLVAKFIDPAFEKKGENGGVIAAMAVENDPRMLAQQGAFTVHSAATPFEDTEGSGAWLCKFVLPPKAAAFIAVQLKFLGIRRSNLFPDLHNLAAELRIDHGGGF